jgi:hypothetical protein
MRPTGTYGRNVRAAALVLVSVLVLVPAVTRAFDRAASSSTVRAGFSFKRSVDRPPDKLLISPDAIAAPGDPPIHVESPCGHRSSVAAADLSIFCLYLSTPRPLRAPPHASA